MEITRSKTIKTSGFTISGFLDKLNKSFKTPQDTNFNFPSGEGSSFFSIPTKRSFVPRATTHNELNDMVEENSFLDFSPYLMPFVVCAAAPDLSSRRASNDLRNLIKQKYQNSMLVTSSHATLPPPVIKSAGLVSHSNPLSKSEEEIIHEILQSPLVPTEQQWNSLNQMRIHANAPERTEKGIQYLLQYYAQLCWLEERFPFETGKIHIPFVWHEAFYKKKITTFCIQYEKAAVMWNIGAVFSHLGASQCLWTQEGLKSSAQYFQKAAGAFVHIRDVLFPRFKVHVDDSSDLSQFTLTATIEIMLAQAIECYYEKAEYDNTSSPVTSQIAIQVADYYDLAYKSTKQNTSFGKSRFPKSWSTTLHIKHLMFSSLAHLHCPNILAPEEAVGERHSRLKLAYQIVKTALDKCTSSSSAIQDDPHSNHKLNDVIVNPELAVHCAATLTRIQRALESIDSANYETFHQTVLPFSKLSTLRRPPMTLVSPYDIIDGKSKNGINNEDQVNGASYPNNCLLELIKNSTIRDIFDGVVGVMCLQSGAQSPVVPSSINSSTVTSRRESLEDWNSQSKTQGTRNSNPHIIPPLKNNNPFLVSNVQNLNNAENSNGISSITLDLVKKFVWDTKQQVELHCLKLTESIQSCSITLSSARNVTDFIDVIKTLSGEDYNTDSRMDLSGVVTTAQQLISFFRKCQSLNASMSTDDIALKLEYFETWMTRQLNELYKLNWDDKAIVRQLLEEAAKNGQGSVSELLERRTIIRQWFQEWYNDESSTEYLRENDTQADKNVPFVMKERKRVLFDLLTSVETEGFKELFASNSNGDELCWSVEKLETVIPCLEPDWLSSLKKSIVELQAFYCLLEYTNQRHTKFINNQLTTEELSNFHPPNHSQFRTVTELVPLVIREYHSYLKKVDSLKSKLELNHAKLMDEEEDLFGGRETILPGDSGDGVRRLSEPIHIHRHAILETLLKLGRQYSSIQNSLPSSSISSTELYMKYGIEMKKKQITVKLDEIKLVIDEASILLNIYRENNMDNHQFNQESSSNVVPCRFNRLMSEIAIHIETEQSSHRIINVFDEQLKKWVRWRNDCEKEVKEWNLVKEWMIKNFGECSSNESPFIYGNDNGSQNGAEDDMLNCQVTSNKIANKMNDEISNRYEKMAHHSNGISDVTQSNSLSHQRKDMLRAMSMTASSIQRQASVLNNHFQAKSVPDGIPMDREKYIRQQHDLLVKQIRLLREQQLQFVRGDYKHIKTQKQQATPGLGDDYRTPIEAPKKNVIYGAKSTLMKLINPILNFKEDHQSVNLKQKRDSTPSAPLLQVDDLIRENSDLRNMLYDQEVKNTNFPVTKMPYRQSEKQGSVRTKNIVMRKPVEYRVESHSQDRINDYENDGIDFRLRGHCDKGNIQRLSKQYEHSLEKPSQFDPRNPSSTNYEKVVKEYRNKYVQQHPSAVQHSNYSIKQTHEDFISGSRQSPYTSAQPNLQTNNGLFEATVRRGSHVSQDQKPASRRESIKEKIAPTTSSTSPERRVSAISTARITTDRVLIEENNKFNTGNGECSSDKNLNLNCEVTPISYNDYETMRLSKEQVNKWHRARRSIPKSEKTILSKVQGDFIEERETAKFGTEKRGMDLRKGMEEVSRFMGWHVQRTR